MKCKHCLKKRLIMLDAVTHTEFGKIERTSINENICLPCFLSLFDTNGVITHLPKQMVDEVKE